MGLGPGRAVGQGQSSSCGGPSPGQPKGKPKSDQVLPLPGCSGPEDSPDPQRSSSKACVCCCRAPGWGARKAVGSAPAFCTVTERRTWPCGDTRQELHDQVTAEPQSHALDGTLPKSSWLSIYDVSGSATHALRIQALHPHNNPMRNSLSLPSPSSFHREARHPQVTIHCPKSHS